MDEAAARRTLILAGTAGSGQGADKLIAAFSLRCIAWADSLLYVGFFWHRRAHPRRCWPAAPRLPKLRSWPPSPRIQKRSPIIFRMRRPLACCPLRRNTSNEAGLRHCPNPRGLQGIRIALLPRHLAGITHFCYQMMHRAIALPALARLHSDLVEVMQAGRRVDAAGDCGCPIREIASIEHHKEVPVSTCVLPRARGRNRCPLQPVPPKIAGLLHPGGGALYKPTCQHDPNACTAMRSYGAASGRRGGGVVRTQTRPVNPPPSSNH